MPDGATNGSANMEGQKELVTPADSPPGADRSLPERLVRRFFEHPYRFPLAAMLIGLGISLLRGPVADLRLLLASCAVFALWLRLWVPRRTQDPTGRSPFTMVVGVVG